MTSGHFFHTKQMIRCFTRNSTHWEDFSSPLSFMAITPFLILLTYTEPVLPQSKLRLFFSLQLGAQGPSCAVVWIGRGMLVHLLVRIGSLCCQFMQHIHGLQSYQVLNCNIQRSDHGLPLGLPTIGGLKKPQVIVDNSILRVRNHPFQQRSVTLT